MAIIIVFISIAYSYASADTFTTPLPSEKDTSIVFEPALDIYSKSNEKSEKANYIGPSMLFSDHGFGMGMYYSYAFTRDFAIDGQFFISGAHNSDEFEIWDWNYYDYRVPNKVNRIYMMPVTLGLKYRLFSNIIPDNLRPYLIAGGGMSVIMATPYRLEFFTAFGEAQTFIKPTLFAGLGLDVMSGRNAINFNMKYYHIPFGAEGLESIKNKPITNFGGIFLEISFGIPIGR